jgi:tripartite-type tricarboxylate transporter receptor subunit TctC
LVSKKAGGRKGEAISFCEIQCGGLSTRKPTTLDARGGLDMDTQVRGPTIKRWAGILITLLSMMVVFSPYATAADEAGASNYPNHPIVLVAPFPPGHVTDTEIRKIAPMLAEALGQPVTVENWPGKSGTVALEKMKHMAPDGYTLIMHGINGLVIAPHVMKVGYDSIADFTPIILEFYKVGHLVLVAYPELPVNSVQELIAYGKRNPGKLTAGSFGTATNVHMAMVEFNRETGLAIPVTELTGANILDEVEAGKVQLMVNFPPSVAKYVKSGKLKALAVTHGRSPLLPDVPTFEEAGLPGMDENTSSGWQGFLAPAGTPPEIVARLNAEIWKIFQSLNDKEGVTIRHANTPEEFAAFLKAENARWEKFINADRAEGMKYHVAIGTGALQPTASGESWAKEYGVD